MPQSTTASSSPEQRSAYAASTKATQVTALQRALSPSGSSGLPRSARASLGMARLARKAVEGWRQHGSAAASSQGLQTTSASSTDPHEPAQTTSSEGSKSRPDWLSRVAGFGPSRSNRPTTGEPQELPLSGTSATTNASSGKTDLHSHWEEPQGTPWLIDR
jgi:hypothetical protein